MFETSGTYIHFNHIIKEEELTYLEYNIIFNNFYFEFSSFVPLCSS